MRKFTYIDTESAWDEGLHAASQRINSHLQPFHRIASKRIFAAAAFDLSVSADGAISIEGIAHWSADGDCDERRVVRDLFHHLHARTDRVVIGYGSIATDVQLLQLAAQEYSLVLPQHFRAERPRYQGVDAPGRHFDLGLAIKNGSKTWHHLSEVLVRIGLPSFLMAGKKHVLFPHNDEGWADVRAHVQLDCALLAVAHLAWLRAQGQAGVDSWAAALAVLEWLRRNATLTETVQAKLKRTCEGLAGMISDEHAMAG